MSRKNFGAKPLTYPQPVFIIATYDENGNADAMNAAWGGISEGDELSLCLSAGHKTVIKDRCFYSKYGRCQACRRVRLCRYCVS